MKLLDLTSYSVLLLYPEAVNDGGEETYYAHVVAKNVKEAIAKARHDALEANDFEDVMAEDFPVLLVIEGHHRGLGEDD